MISSETFISQNVTTFQPSQIAANAPLHMADKKTKLADNKTKPTATNVVEFLHTITPEQKRQDCFVLLQMMQAIGEEPILWSNSIVGFGIKRHKSQATGREADWMRIGFAPRKTNLSLYFGIDIGAHAASLEKLGKYKAGLGCLYINKLADVDLNVLKEMIQAGCNQQ